MPNQYTVPRPLGDLLREKIAVRGKNECWDWIPSCKGGRPEMMFNGKRKLVSYWIYFHVTGRWPPEGKQLNHRCDRPVCCNSRHLELGTQKMNMVDMYRRGRGNSYKGERHPKAKLTSRQVYAIRAAHRRGESGVSLAHRFRVTSGTIYLIVHRVNWKHLPLTENRL